MASLFALILALGLTAATALPPKRDLHSILPNYYFGIVNVANGGGLAAQDPAPSPLTVINGDEIFKWTFRVGEYGTYYPHLLLFDSSVTFDNSTKLMRLVKYYRKVEALSFRIDDAGDNTYVIKAPNEDRLWTLTDGNHVTYAPANGEKSQLWKFYPSTSPDPFRSGAEA
ncbi:hypothetical protein EXIGLDRAFT_777948 [Exidia glandulosa HHB12029]|uniref:Ricin B lectin domain-containing protein n=1 Tax=Exidia glandulosa HHB12029 TaxID=1314781 RepID=A0A165CT33_EXIGL|nr:hypothetical protein EXIGLDRAFT_777948 [Exidia glandulosa HHB12029]